MAPFDLLAGAQDSDGIHLQEMSPPGVKGGDESGRLLEWRGHTILWARHTAIALVIHRRWFCRNRGTFAKAGACGAAIETHDEGLLIIVSAHGPTTWEGDSEWFDFLFDLKVQIEDLSALGGNGRTQMLAGGDWNTDLDSDSDRFASLEETLRAWAPICGPPTFVRPAGGQVPLGGFYAQGAWAPQFAAGDGARLRFRSDHTRR